MARQFDTSDTALWSDRFGYGVDGAKTVSSSETYDGARASCSGTSGTTAVTLGAASTFANNDLVLLHQTRGTGAGDWELNRISSGAGTTSLTMSYGLINTYTDSGASQAQIVELKQYTSVTVNASQTWSAPDWDGDTGGILAFLCTGTTTVTGTISASGKGYRGGSVGGLSTTGNQGEGTSGAGTSDGAANGNGGGGGRYGGTGNVGNSAAGGGHSATASNGPVHAEGGVNGATAATGGVSAGSAALTTAVFGGGFILIISKEVSVSGAVSCAGLSATTGSIGNHDGGGGGGAGGAILVKGQRLTLGSSLMTAAAGVGAQGCSGQHSNIATDGTTGRIHADYSMTLSGSTTPTLDSSQDNIFNDFGGAAILAIAP